VLLRSRWVESVRMAVLRRVYKKHKDIPPNRDEKKDDKSTPMIAQRKDKRYSALHGDS